MFECYIIGKRGCGSLSHCIMVLPSWGALCTATDMGRRPAPQQARCWDARGHDACKSVPACDAACMGRGKSKGAMY